ncbi:MAG: L-threonylcarbamoyladenylate synthase [Eubacterium sp.]|nr:L-threonylcarbamoyladenylate synthase [Eubacterium sp.]
MKTEIFKADSPLEGILNVAKAGELLMAGETVVFPTETVYGLGANALDAAAVKKIFEAKGRPSDNPLIVHIGNTDDLKSLVAEVPQKAQELMAQFWPGPLTMIMEKTPAVPEVVTAGLDTVAVRFPSNPIAIALIRAAHVPVAAPSANISGRPSPTKAEHVIEDMMGRVAAIVTVEDSTDVGLESTVMDMTTEPPTMLRPGGITVAEIEAVIGKIEVSPNVIENVIPEKAKSPGMKYTHYSPKGDLVIVKGSDAEKLEKINKNIKRHEEMHVGILATDETMGNYKSGLIISLGSRKNPEEMSRNLFDRLRSFDELGVEKIYAEDIEVDNSTLALVNRLYKAGGYHFI